MTSGKERADPPLVLSYRAGEQKSWRGWQYRMSCSSGHMVQIVQLINAVSVYASGFCYSES